MDIGRLFDLADLSRSGKRLTAADVAFVREAVPERLTGFPEVELPNRFRHPAGFTVTGAPVGTFVKAAALLCGQRVFGKRCEGSDFYQNVEMDLAFGVMRSHFHHGYPKGTHCCTQCTLAVYPVLASGGIRYFDTKPLAVDVRRLIETGGWRFARRPSEAMVKWSLSE